MSKKLHIHLQTNPKAPDVFHLTPERYRGAAKRNPEVARQVKCTTASDEEGFYRAMKTADGLVGWWFPRKGLREIAPQLKWIHVIGAGVEHLLPLDWIPKGLQLINNKGIHGPKIGDYAAMALLMLHNAMPTLITNQRKGQWREIYSTTIRGKTVLVIGVGQMGGATAQRAKGLGLHVLGVRRTPRGHRYVDEMYGVKDLPKLIPRADFVVVTTPVTSETRGFIGKRELDLMRPDASFMNIARADVVDYDALARKLKRGEIKGAILDVFDPEPLPKSSPLWNTPNLIMTPHVASDDAEDYIPRTLDLTLDNIGRQLSGRRMANRVIVSREY